MRSLKQVVKRGAAAMVQRCTIQNHRIEWPLGDATSQSGNKTLQLLGTGDLAARLRWHRLSAVILVCALLPLDFARAQGRSPVNARLRQLEERARAEEVVLGDLVQQIERLHGELRVARGEFSKLNSEPAAQSAVVQLKSLEDRVAKIEEKVSRAISEPMQIWTDSPRGSRSGESKRNRSPSRTVESALTGRWTMGTGATFDLTEFADSLYVRHVAGDKIRWANARLRKSGDGSFRGVITGVFASDPKGAVRTVPLSVQPITNVELAVSTEFVLWNSRGVETSRSAVSAFLNR